MVTLVNVPTIAPDSNFNFVGTGKVSPNILCTRPSTGFYMNSRGLPTQAPANTPRVEYDWNGQCLGMLNEEGSTNVLTYSETHSNSAWVRTGTAVGEVLQVGDMKFSVIEETATTSRHGIARALDTSQTTTTLQMYLLVRESQDSVENSRTSCVVRLPLVDKGGVGEDAAVCKIDLLTGRISTSIEGSAFQSSNFVWQVTRYISGVVRIYVHYKTHKPTLAQMFFSTTEGSPGSVPNNPSYLGVTGKHILVGGWQQNTGVDGLQGASYIPTTATAATRAADVLSVKVPIGRNSGKYTIQIGFTPIRLIDKSNATDGTKYGSVRGSGKLFQINGNGTDMYALYLSKGEISAYKSNVYVSGLTVKFSELENEKKFVVTQLGARTRIFGNGAASDVDSPTSLGFSNDHTMYIGCGSSKSEQLTCYITNIAIWPDGVIEQVGRNLSMV